MKFACAFVIPICAKLILNINRTRSIVKNNRFIVNIFEIKLLCKTCNKIFNTQFYFGDIDHPIEYIHLY